VVEAFLTVLVTAIIEASASPQQVECTNCSDYAGLAGVILAVAALVVSALSLYVSALNRAKIEVDHVSHGAELAFTGWTGPTPDGTVRVTLKLAVGNTGAAGTFLERLDLSKDFWVVPADQSPFTRLKPERIIKPSGASHGVPQQMHVPVAFERGDARALELHGMLLIRDPQDTHEFARQLRRLESVEFEVAHKYLRPGFVRRGRKRTVLKKQRVKVDAGYLRKSAKGQWGKHEAYADEARIFAGES